jgi:7-cyano-7-deazaguanine synthase in queuosine biosynthesis
MRENPDQYHVTAANGDITVARGKRRQDVFVGLNSFFRMLPRALPPRVVDLLVIASGVYAIDRMATRASAGRLRDGIRSFDITFAVQEPGFWSDPKIAEALCDTLRFLTDDDWSLSFVRSAENGYQPILSIPWVVPTRIALFSEGLDSAAGLADQVLRSGEKIMAVTVSHYSALRTRTRTRIEELRRLVPSAQIYPVSLVVGLRAGLAGNLRDQEKTQRSRALLFGATGIAAACACEVENVDLYENGVGAINVPLMTGMLFGGLASRGAHPSLLDRMSKLAAAVAERSICFSLPYLASTKGELLASLRGLGLEDWLRRSRSCIHTSPRTPKTTHCGVCPACIERRQAFAVAGVEDDLGAYSVDICKKSLPDPANQYFELLLEDCAALLDNNSRPARRLRTYMMVMGIDDTRYPQLYDLSRRHAMEVRDVFPSHSSSMPPDVALEASEGAAAGRVS